jgi:hypothetical protein
VTHPSALAPEKKNEIIDDAQDPALASSLSMHTHITAAIVLQGSAVRSCWRPRSLTTTRSGIRRLKTIDIIMVILKKNKYDTENDVDDTNEINFATQ